MRFIMIKLRVSFTDIFKKKMQEALEHVHPNIWETLLENTKLVCFKNKLNIALYFLTNYVSFHNEMIIYLVSRGL